MRLHSPWIVYKYNIAKKPIVSQLIQKPAIINKMCILVYLKDTYDFINYILTEIGEFKRDVELIYCGDEDILTILEKQYNNGYRFFVTDHDDEDLIKINTFKNIDKILCFNSNSTQDLIELSSNIIRSSTPDYNYIYFIIIKLMYNVADALALLSLTNKYVDISKLKRQDALTLFDTLVYIYIENNDFSLRTLEYILKFNKLMGDRIVIKSFAISLTDNNISPELITLLSSNNISEPDYIPTLFYVNSSNNIESEKLLSLISFEQSFTENYFVFNDTFLTANFNVYFKYCLIVSRNYSLEGYRYAKLYNKNLSVFNFSIYDLLQFLTPSISNNNDSDINTFFYKLTNNNTILTNSLNPNDAMSYFNRKQAYIYTIVSNDTIISNDINVKKYIIQAISYQYKYNPTSSGTVDIDKSTDSDLTKIENLPHTVNYGEPSEIVDFIKNADGILMIIKNKAKNDTYYYTMYVSGNSGNNFFYVRSNTKNTNRRTKRFYRMDIQLDGIYEEFATDDILTIKDYMIRRWSDQGYTYNTQTYPTWQYIYYYNHIIANDTYLTIETLPIQTNETVISFEVDKRSEGKSEPPINYYFKNLIIQKAAMILKKDFYPITSIVLSTTTSNLAVPYSLFYDYVHNMTYDDYNNPASDKHKEYLTVIFNHKFVFKVLIDIDRDNVNSLEPSKKQKRELEAAKSVFSKKLPPKSARLIKNMVFKDYFYVGTVNVLPVNDPLKDINNYTASNWENWLNEEKLIKSDLTGREPSIYKKICRSTLGNNTYTFDIMDNKIQIYNNLDISNNHLSVPIIQTSNFIITNIKLFIIPQEKPLPPLPPIVMMYYSIENKLYLTNYKNLLLHLYMHPNVTFTTYPLLTSDKLITTFNNTVDQNITDLTCDIYGKRIGITTKDNNSNNASYTCTISSDYSISSNEKLQSEGVIKYIEDTDYEIKYIIPEVDLTNQADLIIHRDLITRETAYTVNPIKVTSNTKSKSSLRLPDI